MQRDANIPKTPQAKAAAAVLRTFSALFDQPFAEEEKTGVATDHAVMACYRELEENLTLLRFRDDVRAVKNGERDFISRLDEDSLAWVISNYEQKAEIAQKSLAGLDTIHASSGDTVDTAFLRKRYQMEQDTLPKIIHGLKRIEAYCGKHLTEAAVAGQHSR